MMEKIKYSKKYGFSYVDKVEYDRKREKKVQRYANNPQYRNQSRSADLKWRYGITREEKDKMIQDQDNKCLRCGLRFEGTGQDALAPVVDHDHSFEKGDPNSIRGILHSSCNKAVTTIEELQISIDYLKKYGVKK